MEITSFVLGMLAIVTVALVAVIVVGIVKILKLTKQVNYVTTRLNISRGELYQHINDAKTEIWRQFEETGRDITMVEKTIMNQIDQARQETGKATHTVRTDLSGYIDSRIDKLIDTYFEHVGAKKSKKEVING
jgi:predicted Holliday junction resolvase-like endonuclease